MTDRELLELAAKAARMEPWRQFVDESYGMGVLIPNGLWNPLTDDGDALRLAVKIAIPVCFAADGTLIIGYANEPAGDDPYAAARRAIVRSAAAIGKEM
jgi:hypothetical protein